MLLLLCVAACAAAAEIPAFPGAEGYGAMTRGGRGGKVLLVRNLNDSGPGSFRAAVTEKGPRIVVFRVSGVIDLKSPVRITEPFLTVAGQTAPGDGICFRGAGISVDASEVILRYLRFRPGDISGKEVDGLAIGGESKRVIVDHCSASWSVDECLSPSGALADVTVQWCIIAEGLNHSVHHKGPHGYGSLVRAVGGLTMHHNLWAHQTARSPRLGDNYGKPPYPTFDIRNNVIYGWSGVASGMTGDILDANYVANYLKPGPDSNLTRGAIVLTATAKPRYYVRDNHIPQGMRVFSNEKQVTVVDKPFAAPPVRTTPPAQAYQEVLEHAGASLPRRDAVDRRIVEQVRTGTGHIIDSQWEVGGWPEYRSERPPVDTDRDGMPDDWEKARGLNPRDPSDAAKDRDTDGYTNIEEYINSLAWPAKRAAASAPEARSRK
jgi:pectate lyase